MKSHSELFFDVFVRKTLLTVGDVLEYTTDVHIWDNTRGKTESVITINRSELFLSIYDFKNEF